MQKFLRQLTYHTVVGEEVGEMGSLGSGGASPILLGASSHTPRTWGTTWMELYILYRLGGHPEPVTYIHTSAKERPTLKAQLQTFRNSIRTLIHTTMPTKYHPLCKGINISAKRLQPLGIDTMLAVLPFQLHSSLTSRTRIAA